MAKKKSDPGFPVAHAPKARTYIEKIGDRELVLVEKELNVLTEVVLWDKNPRLQPQLPHTGMFKNEAAVEAALQVGSGYQHLRRSIEDIGQMEAIYVWKRDDKPGSKYLVLEGATRVAALRDLARKHGKNPKGSNYLRVKAKVLPPDFREKERTILLAKIHVRGTGVHAWDRYVQARFIHDNVIDHGSDPEKMTVTEMANYMGKSVSWVQRLRDAYEFASKFKDHVDNDDAVRLATDHFSTLEEISKSTAIGPKLREYDNVDHDALRAEVFDMVKNEVFSEYRDARFMKEFFDDPEKWAALKTGEKGIAKKLAADLKTSSSTAKAKIAGLEQAVERAFERDPTALDDHDIVTLRRCITAIEARVHPGVRPFRAALVAFTGTLSDASLSDVKAVHPDELVGFIEAFQYLQDQVTKHGVALPAGAEPSQEAAVS